MRIVVLTYAKPRGVEVVRALCRNGIEIDAIVIDRGAKSAAEQFATVRRAVRHRGLAQSGRAALRRLKRSGSRVVVSPPFDHQFSSFSRAVYVVNDANDPECEELLRRLTPDLIVLGPARILRPHIIGVPRIGILNAHPGLLPEYRGVDVIPWAVYNGDPLGVSVHFVDAGVDTGPVVATRGLQIGADDTLSSLKDKAHRLAAELMADVVRELVDTGHVDAVVQTSKNPQYYRMPRDLLQETEQKLADMKP